MKTVISMPDMIFSAAERLAKQLGISHSELFKCALTNFLKEHSHDGVTKQLNAIYGNGKQGKLDPILARMQSNSIGEESW